MPTLKVPDRLRKWVPSPITAILLALIAWLWFFPPADVSTETRALPPWQVTLPDGRVVTSASLRGKVVLVSFWATWCPYCRKEKPVIEAYWQAHRARGFEVVAISIDDTPEQLAAWMRDKGYSHMSAPLDPSVVDAFGRVAGVPASVILDRQGRVRARVEGQLHAGRLDDLAAPLLDEAGADAVSANAPRFTPPRGDPPA